MKPIWVFFRNDDVGYLSDQGLHDISQLFFEYDIPLIHAVVPATISETTASWLGETAQVHPKLVEIIQHGWRHHNPLFEFKGNQPYEVQREQIKAGKMRMKDLFGDTFFPAFSFPGGYYNRYSLPVLNDLDFKVFSSHCSHRWWWRTLYACGHLLNRGRLFNRHISYHGNNYPHTNVRELSISINMNSVIHSSGFCVKDAKTIMGEFEHCIKFYDIVGFLIHHRFFTTEKRVGLLASTLQRLKNNPNIRFATFRTLMDANVHD